jgi:hypothetical protein
LISINPDPKKPVMGKTRQDEDKTRQDNIRQPKMETTLKIKVFPKKAGLFSKNAKEARSACLC